jgi:branched-chain amino acid transport system ATP-binding protein
MNTTSSTHCLKAEKLTRRWGGLIAVNEVNLDLFLGEIHAVIGTNGAGKSTLINLLSGEIPLSSGRVELLGIDVTSMSQPTRAHMGLGKSYQKNTIFPEITVLENVRLSAQTQLQKPWSFWQNAYQCKYSNDYALHIAEKTGLTKALATQAGFLSHGQKRQLEVAMCLATNPKVLLLDEPLAGMGADETDRMLNFLMELRQEHAMMLVEHDMDAVFKVADVITVMVNGSVIARGTPDEVKNNPEVQSAYLGAES